MKSELTKDKYLALALVVVLLAAYIYTSDAIIQTLLTTAVGGFLGLVRSGSTTTTAIGGAGSPAIEMNAEVPPVALTTKAVKKAKEVK